MYKIGHSGILEFYRTGIKTVLGAKRIARKGIQQSAGGRIEIFNENGELISVLFGHDKKWTDIR